MWLKTKLGYNDTLDVFDINRIGGIIGAILTGVFVAEAVSGISSTLESNAAQIGLKFFSVGITVAYSRIVTFVLVKVVEAVIGLRAKEEHEREGLDIKLHGESVT